MNHHLIIVLILVDLTSLSTMIMDQPYYCKLTSPEVYRILTYDNHFFIILNDTIVQFAKPTIYNKDNSYRIRHPTSITHKEIDISLGQLVGYHIIIKQSMNKMTNNVDVIEMHRLNGFLEKYPIEFDPIPGVRGDLISSHIETNPDYTFKIMIENWILRQNLSFIYSNETLYVDRIKGKSLRNKLLVYNDTIMMANVLTETGTSNIQMIALDQSEIIHFHGFTLERLMSLRSWSSFKMPILSLLSCFQPFTDWRQLKGIYFEQTSSLFLIFIDRYYLAIDESLNEKDFKIETQDYTKGIELSYEDEEYLKKAYYPVPNKKYPLKFQDKYYFDFGTLFYAKFNDISKELILFKVIDELDRMASINECNGNIINIHNNEYCFDTTNYYVVQSAENYKSQISRLSKKRAAHVSDDLDLMFKIDELFAKTEIEYKNEQLRFIIKYRDQIVLMSEKWLYRIDVSALHVEEPTKKLTVERNLEKTRLSMERNCLFMTCSPTNVTQKYQISAHSITIAIFVGLILLFFGFYLLLNLVNSRLSRIPSSKRLSGELDANRKKSEKLKLLTHYLRGSLFRKRTHRMSASKRGKKEPLNIEKDKAKEKNQSKDLFTEKNLSSLIASSVLSKSNTASSSLSTTNTPDSTLISDQSSNISSHISGKISDESKSKPSQISKSSITSAPSTQSQIDDRNLSFMKTTPIFSVATLTLSEIAKKKQRLPQLETIIKKGER